MSDTYEEDDDYIKIAESEDSEFMEFPKEEDGSMLLSTILTQFPNAIGIKYKGSSGAWRAIKEIDNVLAAPKGGWGDKVYIVTTSDTKKRKLDRDEKDEYTDVKQPRSSVDPLLKDMAVIGLPFKLTSDEMKEYFESNYGELSYCEVKFDRQTGKSRGFGFIRFKDEETAKEALKGDHYIMGRRVEVRMKKEKPLKLFVGRLPDGTTQQELDKHFSQFGELKDTYIPSPFRNFAFITYASTEDGRACLRENHVLNGVRLNVMTRNLEKSEPQRNDNPRGGHGGSRSFSGGYNNRYGGGGGQSSHASQPMQNDMASELKSMLFQFLTSK